MHMVTTDLGLGTGGIKMVISQQTNMVKVVNMVDCKDLNNGVQTPANQGLPSWNSVGKHGTVTERKT